MTPILTITGSNSSTLINHQFITYTAKSIKGHKVRVLDMSEFNFPIFSEDLEKEPGFENPAQPLLEIIHEHNQLL